jgi:small-conductance mechanosensitive channel
VFPVTRPLGYASLAVALVSALAAGLVASSETLVGVTVWSIPVQTVVVRSLVVFAIVAGFYGLYLLVSRALVRNASKRRTHDVRNLLRLVFGAVTVVAVFGVLTAQWLGVLFSLGVVGFAVTFALQQPLLSLVAWVYIMLKRPYAVGDRVKIDASKGDVIEIDFLVTTLWEIDGELVSSHQPSGRVVTVPNSVVLSSQVTNYGGAGIPHVWNEVTVQVAYETDIEFAREVMVAEAERLFGDEMARNVARYRETLAETPVELEVSDRPSVNVVQTQSWVELRLRYLVHPRRGTRVKNALYTAILDRFNATPERVKFPVGRNR